MVNQYFYEFTKTLTITSEAIRDCKQFGMGDVIGLQINQEFEQYMMHRYLSVTIPDVSSDIEYFINNI